MTPYSPQSIPQTRVVKISSIHKNPKNPRIIKDDKFKKLVKSITDFPQMLYIRPIVVDADNMIIGGNMRFEAAKSVGLSEIPIVCADDLTEEQKREFIIKDNVSFGEYDWSELANEWDKETLIEWGFDEYMFGITIDDNQEEDEATSIKEKKQHKCPECGCEFSD